jgi:hypothetical protein
MTVGFSFTYSVLTSMPIKKAKLKSRKGKSPQGLVLLIMMLLLVSKRSFSLWMEVPSWIQMY